MNIVAHLTPCTPNSTVASARVARFLVDTINMVEGENGRKMHLVDTLAKAEEAVLLNGEVRYLFIVNGPMAFCDFLEPLADLVRRAKHVIFVQQDYTIMPPSADSKAESPFRRAFRDLHLRPRFWTTVAKNVKEPHDRYVNWNQLTYDQQEFKELGTGLMYYGAFREKRVPMFMHYFQNTPYKVKVSTTTLRGKKFKGLDSNIEIIPPFAGLGNMPACAASLYIEDPLSSKEFHSPANRFYELLSAGVPIFFDQGALPMLAKASIYPEERWVVKCKEQLYSYLIHHDLELMREQQRALWHADYVGALRNRVIELWEELNNVTSPVK